MESVAWVTERKDVLSGFFGLLALIAYASYAKAGTAKSRWMRYLLMCFFYVLSLLAKPLLVTFPFVLLLVDAWPLRRWQQGRWRWLLVEKIPVALFAVAASVITMRVSERYHSLVQFHVLPLSSRLANAAISYLLYMRDMFYFQDLSFFYPAWRSFPIPLVAGGMVLLATVTAAAILLCRRAPARGWPMLIGWLWFIGTLVPNIGIVQSGLQSRADRFTYFPSIGLFMALVWLWPEDWSLTRTGRLAGGLLGAGAVAVLAVYTSIHILVWADPLLLFATSVQHTYNNGWMENFVGSEFDRQSTELDALAQESHNPGIARQAAQDALQAEAWYKAGILHMPELREIHFNYGTFLARHGRLQEAMVEFTIALKLAPGDPVIRRAYDYTLQQIDAQPNSATETRPGTR